MSTGKGTGKEDTGEAKAPTKSEDGKVNDGKGNEGKNNDGKPTDGVTLTRTERATFGTGDAVKTRAGVERRPAMFMFTAGQVTRMNATLAGPRKTLAGRR